MAEPSMDNRTLLRRTLVVGGTMVGACVLFIASLALIASTIVRQAVSSDTSDAGTGGSLSPPAVQSPAPAGAKTAAGINPTHRK
jgi:uncharacterized iron-regulated membrane protein